jgi:PAS domain S-box-containing protein
MKLKTKKCLYAALVILFVFFIVETLVVLDILDHSKNLIYFNYMCVILFSPLFYTVVKEYISNSKEINRINKYSERLSATLISQSNNTLFYEGKVTEGAKLLTSEVTKTMGVDRCSIWLYDENKTSITCEQLYIKATDSWQEDMILRKQDFEPYFRALIDNPIIIANEAELHPATKCFTGSYLKPTGIKSMLDVPIIYKGDIIGVICIENLTKRDWLDVEVNFARTLSSLYAFAYSIKENNTINDNFEEFESFVDSSVLVSYADAKGKITYVNKKFEKVSGYKYKELIGRDHSIVNSKEHPKEFWNDMYKTVVKDKKIWNGIVTNKKKNGELYWVNSYIKAEFNEDKELTGFVSIRYEVTDVVKGSLEIQKKNTYLEHAAKILRHDMHSGINTYIPRGISSLERRLTPELIAELKLESPLKMLKEGLAHAQKVYKGVYEFTNLVKNDSKLETQPSDLTKLLTEYLSSTAYSKQVAIDALPTVNVNPPLFCTAVDNLIRNGLKYNDSDFKMVAVFMLNENTIGVQDNGRGMTQEEFEHLSKPYTRKPNQNEQGTGLGLNICLAILKEHGFSVSCEKNEAGTLMKIKLT